MWLLSSPTRKSRGVEVVPLLGDAIAQLRHDDLIDESFANKWLDTFLLARISTEMLTLHFMEMQAPSSKSLIIERRMYNDVFAKQI